MAKLERIDLEMQKTREKIAAMQAHLKELDGQRTEQENLQIVQAVRALKLTRDELAAFFSGGTLPAPMGEAVPAARYSRKKQELGTTGYNTPETTSNYESEDNKNEE
jgi:hypothetical protein